MAVKKQIADYQQRADAILNRWLPSQATLPGRLHEAMRYSTFNGGKRIRPVLVYATGETLNVPREALDGPACAVELIHAYSLVHDDLPAMDDDDLRRGKPTCHRAFDEATAILAGDALQALAFYVLAHDHTIIDDPTRRIRMIEILAQASGSRGMAGGQAIDLGAVGKELTLAELEDMHIHKTGALIRASVKLGALSSSGCDHDQMERLDHYAKCIGLAFQIQDDILDVEGETEILGKAQGADLARNKPTYPALIGLAGAKQMARELHEQALDSLASFGKSADLLRWISTYIVTRNN
ncbi:MAG: geranyl transferase [Gammaproteobacteria bacterium RBG_16_57_12]|nr:MAG: geranyl transferase [Gammaproteobacteria bacterium RBG_16_57_12]